MRIHLPAETWVEIFVWLNRREFARKMELLWDREFSPIAEKWLHEWSRNVCIGKLRFIVEEVKSKQQTGKMMEKQMWLQKRIRSLPNLRFEYMNVPIAADVVEMPSNITSFQSICISYLDPTIMSFMHQMRPLLTNVHLSIGQGERLSDKMLDNYKASLRALLPTISGPLESLTIRNHELLCLFKARFPAVIGGAKMLDYCTQYSHNPVQSLANWLFSPPYNQEEDGGGQPRKLRLYSFINDDLTKFIAEIKKRFLAPDRRQHCAFFIRLYGKVDENLVLLENATMGEQLAVRKPAVGRWVLISCYRISENKERIAEMERELMCWNLDAKERKLFVWYPRDSPRIDDIAIRESVKRRVLPADDEKEGTSGGGEASTSSGVKRKRKFSIADRNKKTNDEDDDDEESKSVRKSERIKQKKQSLLKK